jgi:hypothetical protein
MTAAEQTGLPPALPPPEAAAVPGSPFPSRHRVLVRGLLWGGLGLSFLLTFLTTGLPTDRISVLAWVLGALAAHAVTEGWRRLVRLLADWVPLGALLLLYDASRGLADQVGAAVHVTEPADADRWLGGGVVPTVWLQHHLHADWWQALATLVYSSHFVVTPVVLAVLWMRDRRRWARYARLVLALSAAGLVTYVLYPAAPPWLAAHEGVLPAVHRLSGSGWAVLGLPRAGALLEAGQGSVNPVAAIPSLHTAFAVLTCVVLFPLARRVWQRVGLVVYAVLMPFVLVWSGEHYVVDTVLGALYTGAVVRAGRGVAVLVARRRAAPTVGT